MHQNDDCNDELLKLIVDRMVENHDCHTVLLYGSRAAGQFESTSDYDICGFRKNGEAVCDCLELNGVILDAWIYSETQAKSPDESMLRLRDALVLIEKDGLGEACIDNVRKLFERGPAPLPKWEKQKRVIWLKKTLARTAKGDLEGRYRTLWLLHLALEYYFELRGMWYCGSKESFKWLSENDSSFSTHFQQALDNPFDHKALAAVIDAVIPENNDESEEGGKN